MYAAKHDIVINTNKTECMVIKPARSKVNYPEPSQFRGRALTFVDRVTYMGHVLHRDMTDDADIRKYNTKLTVTGNILLRKFSYCNLEVKLELLMSQCYSLSCNSLWSWFKMATMNQISICHNDVFKRLLWLPRRTSSFLAFTKNGVKSQRCDSFTFCSA